MKIALVRTYQPQPVADTDEIAHPLGIMSLDAYLRTKGYRDIHLSDMRLAKETPEEAADRLLRLEPDLIGLSALTIDKDEGVHKLAWVIKQRRPETIMVVGGPYATSAPKTIIEDRNIDYVVAGEGEVPFHGLVQALETGSPLSAVRGIYYREHGKLCENPPAEQIMDMDSLPLPSWDRIDMAGYERRDMSDRMTGKPWSIFMTSRGCPYRCTYCHEVFGKKFRANSPEKVITELRLLIENYGVREFLIYDDIFNFDRQRVLEICRLIRKQNWKIHLQFTNGVRADLMDTTLLQEMKAAGTFRLSYAIESANKRVQQTMKKHLQLEKVHQLIIDTDKLGLMMHGFFMLGFPGETRKEMLNTIEWAARSRLHTAGFFLVTPFEGTPLSEEYLAPAKLMHGSAFNYYDNPHSMSEVSAAELKRLQRLAYFRFYMNPRRIARLAQVHPQPQKMLGYVKMFAEIVGGGIKIRGADEKRVYRPFRAPVVDGPLPDSTRLRPRNVAIA